LNRSGARSFDHLNLWSKILAGGLGAAAGAVVCFLIFRWKSARDRQLQSYQAQSLLEKARADAEAVLRDARATANEELIKRRDELEKSFAARTAERMAAEQRLSEREGIVNTQLSRILETEQELKSKQEGMQQQKAEIEALSRERRDQLKKISGLSEAEAKAQFLMEIEREAMKDASNVSRQILEEVKARAEEKARQILSVAIQRYAGDHTAGSTTATIALPNDEIKGRIIGREGRNIRAFENATGVTVLVDDTPGAVVLSGFDPVRREIAREAMSRLIADGRIHPTSIEEVVDKVKQEMDETIIKLGEDAVARAALPPMHAEIVKLLGRLHFRQSYSQNVLEHSVEVAHLMGLMASELGLDVTLAKRAGLLHDIGKAVNHEIEGPHAVVGADIIKRCEEPEVVVNAVASHHNDVPPVGPLGILVSAADAISASRPGARSESMTTYIKRIENLERIAMSHEGVEKCYAVQAGRELRVFVVPEKVNDEQAFVLARKVASQIEQELQYPGQIKVTIIRETRCVEVAK